jgi:hypothetical protein
LQPAHDTIQQFSKRLLTLADRDQNGELSLSEFRELMHAFGNPNKDDEVSGSAYHRNLVLGLASFGSSESLLQAFKVLSLFF